MALWTKETEAVVLAAVAGLLGYLMRTIQQGKRIRLLQAAIEAAAAGLVGYLTCHLCEAMGIGREWSAVIIGVFGWMGASSSVVVLQRFVYKRLGAKEEEDVAPGRLRPPRK